MIVVVSAAKTEEVVQALRAAGENPVRIGVMEARSGDAVTTTGRLGL